MNGDGYGGESTAILIDKALEHQNALGVRDDIFGHGSSIDHNQTKSYCWMRQDLFQINYFREQTRKWIIFWIKDEKC